MNLVEDGDGAFFFTRVKVGIGVPGHGDIAVTETAGDLLNINALIGEERSVRVTEVVDAQNGQLGGKCELLILIRYRSITQRTRAAANTEIF